MSGAGVGAETGGGGGAFGLSRSSIDGVKCDNLFPQLSTLNWHCRDIGISFVEPWTAPVDGLYQWIKGAIKRIIITSYHSHSGWVSDQWLKMTKT
jgi:hypothetical protein